MYNSETIRFKHGTGPYIVKKGDDSPVERLIFIIEKYDETKDIDFLKIGEDIAEWLRCRGLKHDDISDMTPLVRVLCLKEWDQAQNIYRAISEICRAEFENNINAEVINASIDISELDSDILDKDEIVQQYEFYITTRFEHEISEIEHTWLLNDIEYEIEQIGDKLNVDVEEVMFSIAHARDRIEEEDKQSSLEDPDVENTKQARPRDVPDESIRWLFRGISG